MRDYNYYAAGENVCNIILTHRLLKYVAMGDGGWGNVEGGNAINL